jgi:hypothetical protein
MLFSPNISKSAKVYQIKNFMMTLSKAAISADAEWYCGKWCDQIPVVISTFGIVE